MKPSNQIIFDQKNLLNYSLEGDSGTIFIKLKIEFVDIDGVKGLILDRGNSYIPDDINIKALVPMDLFDIKGKNVLIGSNPVQLVYNEKAINLFQLIKKRDTQGVINIADFIPGKSGKLYFYNRPRFLINKADLGVLTFQ